MRRAHLWWFTAGCAGLLAICSVIGWAQWEANLKPAVQASRLSHPASPTYEQFAAKAAPFVKVFGMRKFPYPYQAMLAISADADHETLRKFQLVHEFLNTTGNTPLGQGLGLDISDSFFMYNGSNLVSTIDYERVPLQKMFTYFSGVSSQYSGAPWIDAYIKSGWIDTLHTYGDFSMQHELGTLFSRKLAAQAIQALEKNHDNLTVWTDHGNQSNVDNFGAYGTTSFFNYQQGANPRSIYYHTDLLIPYGIRFVWNGNWNAVFGHDSMLFPIRLPDGRSIWGFYRYTSLGRLPSGTVLWNWSSNQLPLQVTKSHLNELVRRHQYAILAQHFYANNTEVIFKPDTIRAFQELGDYYHKKLILVARTSRLLNYNLAEQYIKYTVYHSHGRAIINIERITDPIYGKYIPTLSDVRGITFYTSDPHNTEIEINHKLLQTVYVQYNTNDGVAPSIGIRWFQTDVRNYAFNHVHTNHFIATPHKHV